MFSESTEEALRRTAEEGLTIPLHHRDETTSPERRSSEARDAHARSVSQGEEGIWGERDIGGPVNQLAAMHEFAELQQELSADMMRTTSHGAASHRSTRSGKSILHRIMSRKSRQEQEMTPEDRANRMESKESQERRDHEHVEETQADAADSTDAEDFSLEKFIRDGHLEKRTDTGESTKKVGVVFKHLTVKGAPTGTSTVRTLPTFILGTFGPDLYHLLCRYFPKLRFGRGAHGELRTLIHDFTGVVRPGEMMLVLGRPGSGCSTFLRAIANNCDGYAAVEGEVSYGGIPADEVRRRYRGEVVYNPENDEHLPALTVGQTLRFALLNKTRRGLRNHVDTIVDAFLRMFSIRHTEHTLVGNAFIRGVSGGERKRVSIAETLATKSAVVCWDNSTRGLDASTALDYARSLRIMTDVSGRTTITTLYQAGEGIYELMDRVLVIDQGRMLYQGPATEARKYFEDLGFYAAPRQTTPDFLTSLCDPVSRRFREGWEERCPKTPEELEKAFRQSPAYQRLLADVAEFENHLMATGHSDTRQFQESVQAQKSRRVPSKSNYTVPFWRQVAVCARRELWLIWGNKTELGSKCFTIISNGLIVGSLFYNSPSSTAGSFVRGGAVFFAVVFIGWLQLAELIKAVSGRAVIARHRDYAFYRPSAVILARALTDFLVLIPQVVVFVTILYFMSGLDRRADKFFIQLLFTYTTAISLTGLYRLFAALSPTIDDAVRFASMALNILAMCTGYVIARPVLLSQKIWFGWIAYVNPVSDSLPFLERHMRKD
jgi:ATP-binding cassette subfamily G (WHITE) protein 2 (SNQ2)